METIAIDMSTASGQVWEFAQGHLHASPRDPEPNWQPIVVPGGGWRAQGHAYDNGVYRTQITVPESAAGKWVRLVFEALNFQGWITIQDERGEQRIFLEADGSPPIAGWVPIVFDDFGEFLKPGTTSMVTVKVRGRKSFIRDGKYLVAQGATWQDVLADGILRGVRLEIVPPVYGDQLWVKTDLENDVFEPQIALDNTSWKSTTARLEAVVSGPHAFAYPSIPPVTVTLWPGEKRGVSLGSTPWGLGPDSYWWPNVPYREGYRPVLHDLTVTITPDEGEPHVIRHRFGFRQFQAKGAHYYLNGVRCNLRGDNQQEANFGTDAYGVHPGFGPPTADNPGWPKAVDNLLRLNFNVLRIHQIPATPYMLDVCDELGLMIIDETPIRGSERMEDFVGGRENMIRAARDLAVRDRHHPSIVLWSAANEIWDERGLALALQAAMLAVDDTRPIIIDGVDDLGPEIINMQHYVGHGPGLAGLGVLPEVGGTPRADRPYGETESVWPADNHPQGFAWMSTGTRLRRLKNNADIRNYVLNNAWPNYVPGHGPEQQYLEKKIKDIRWEHVEKFGMEMMPAIDDPWDHPLIQLMQRSFHPFLACDVAFDELNKNSDLEGRWPTTLPVIKAGEMVTREIAVFNDALNGGDVLTLRWEMQVDGMPVEGQSGAAVLQIPYGEYRVRKVGFTAPAGAASVTLALAVERDGEVVFREDRIGFIVGSL